MGFKATDSLSEQIAQHLAEQIMTGDLVEGERIQELRIAKELNVSRGSVREALLLLERRHLISIYPRRGAVVSELSTQHVKSLYEIVTLLLSLLARRAAENWRVSDLEAYVAQLRRIKARALEQDVELFSDEVFEFFRVGYRFAQNPYVEDMLEDLEHAVKRTTYLALHSVKQSLNDLVNGLQRVLDAIEQRDPDLAVQRVEELGRDQRDLVLEALLRLKQVELAWAQRHRR
ncbi:MAG: GntR family transcriptional regulator [Pseudomonadales bacterium]|nr:GntR family transcriptional regulator [Pseudomonadales bacterium]